MSRRILIVGSTGQLGKELQRSFGGFGEIVCCHREQFNLADESQTRAMVRQCAPQIILNAAAYTAVDKAESEPDLAMAINGQAPGFLAEEARRLDALLVHYSTDYVFDGTKSGPWVETDVPHPQNVYGATKLAGEQAVAGVGGKFLIFRTSWVYGPRGGNFLLTMLRLARQRDEISVVDDQHGAPTTSIELADATFEVVRKIESGECGHTADWSGLYHMTCGGATTWCGFARAIFARAGELLGGKAPTVRAIPSQAYPTPAKRPSNSVLSNEKLRSQFGVRLAPWETALDTVFQELAQPAVQS